jgi:lipopolysaccharide export system permease protein
VVFDRYAFDLSRFNRVPNINYSLRERYLWELILPPADDALAKAKAGQLRAELHDRLLAPLYPIAFVILTYAFLGAPRTTRQSRALSIAAAVALVAALRLIGLASTAIGIHVPLALAAQYVAMAAAIAFGLTAIGRGMIMEPPAAVAQLLATLGERIARRTGMAAPAS